MLQDLTAFCFKTSLRFASISLRFASISLRFASISLSFAQDLHCVLLEDLIAFCLRKENGFYILQSIDQGPFDIGTTRTTLGTTPEGGVLLGPVRPRTYDDLDDNEKKRFDAGSELTKEDKESQLYDEFELFKMLPCENINEYYVRFHKLVNDIRNIRMTMPNIQLNFKFVNNMLPEWDRFVTAVKLNKVLKETNHETRNCNGIGHIARNCTQPKRPQNYDYFKDKMLLMQAQKNGAVLDEEELLFMAGEQANTVDADVDNQPVQDLALNEDNIFQANKCDAFDLDVDDKPNAQSIFMANLSLAGPANLQAGSSNALILSEVPDLDYTIVVNNYDQVEHEIPIKVQQSMVINSNNADMGNSNVISYEQYMTTNDVSVVPSCASSAPNNAYVLIDNNVHTSHEPLVTELAIYKEQVAIYE
ncbi:hypothetical protein Tco_0619235 [Tanacetum coccineum]